LGGDENIFGLTQGSVVLLSGEPGIGKSTLLTMAMLKFLKNYSSFKIFYVCGEESPEQINLRIKRLINN
jgi:DNA repair protein RadA/Sms